ncbi:MAG: hypothetical protein FJX72_01145 [Armatimonadetes bacterium]|nr:hypothetical protein [Armatimonadota bacterium]
MPVVLELPSDTEDALRRAAAEAGLTLEDFVTRNLLRPNARTTGRDLARCWAEAGVWGAWPERSDIGDASEFARALRDRAQHRWDY